MKSKTVIPAKEAGERDQEVLEIHLFPGSNKVHVILKDPDHKRHQQVIDVTDEWVAAAPSQRGVLNGFNKVIGAKGIKEFNLKMGYSDQPITVEGDLFVIPVVTTTTTTTTTTPEPVE